MISMTPDEVTRLAAECGFELAGVAPALPISESQFYRKWVNSGFAAEMTYLQDRRAAVREDPRNLLASARSIICVGKLYQTPYPYSNEAAGPGHGWISRYAWGDDYHDVMRAGLERLAERLQKEIGAGFEYRACVDTAPLLERAYARRAGLGWIGKNSCLINQQQGSWFFLGELLVSFDLEPSDPPPDRCGSCTRCIDACPTAAIVPTSAEPAYTVDSRLCIAYLTIEKRGDIDPALHAGMSAHVFGCDICQEVCPWNRRAPVTDEPAFLPTHFAPALAELESMTEEEFRREFHGSPVSRAKFAGMQRNVRIARANDNEKYGNG